MKKTTKVSQESSKENSPEEKENQEEEETPTEMEVLKNQNFSLQELHNLKDQAYYRVRVLNSLDRIARAVEEMSLEEEELSEEEVDEDTEEEEK